MHVNNQQAEQMVGNLGLARWWRNASLGDLLHARGHSADFGSLRAEYVSMRVRLLAFLSAALAPLWIPIDYYFLDSALFLSLLSMRLVFSACYLGVGLWSRRPSGLGTARARLFLFLLVPGLFYVASRALMDEAQADQAILVGYSFLPFLLVALLAVFPLTLVEGAAAALVVGAFVVGSELMVGGLFTLPTLANLWLLGLLASIAIWAELTQLHMLLRLYREATRDMLTRLVNRRVLQRWLGDEVAQARRTQRPLSVLLFDLDLFKRINDNYGHLVGDAVLRAFSELLTHEAEGALVGRFGGEEFLAILPGKGSGEALEVAERIRQACHALKVPAGRNQTVAFTTSIGVAELARGEEPEELIARVDKGLYRAKEAGRDSVTLAE